MTIGPLRVVSVSVISFLSSMMLLLLQVRFHSFSFVYLFVAGNVPNENRQKAKMNRRKHMSAIYFFFFKLWPSTIQIFFSQACFIQAADVVPRYVSWSSFNRATSKTSDFNVNESGFEAVGLAELKPFRGFRFGSRQWLTWGTESQ